MRYKQGDKVIVISRNHNNLYHLGLKGDKDLRYDVGDVLTVSNQHDNWVFFYESGDQFGIRNTSLDLAKSYIINHILSEL